MAPFILCPICPIMVDVDPGDENQAIQSHVESHRNKGKPEPEMKIFPMLDEVPLTWRGHADHAAKWSPQSAEKK